MFADPVSISPFGSIWKEALKSLVPLPVWTLPTPQCFQCTYSRIRAFDVMDIPKLENAASITAGIASSWICLEERRMLVRSSGEIAWTSYLPTKSQVNNLSIWLARPHYNYVQFPAAKSNLWKKRCTGQPSEPFSLTERSFECMQEKIRQSLRIFGIQLEHTTHLIEEDVSEETEKCKLQESV